MNEKNKFLPADLFSWGPAGILGNPACRAYPQGRENFPLDHFPFCAEGTNSGVLARNPRQQILPGLFGRFLRFFIGYNPQKLPAAQKLFLMASVAQQSVMPDLDESIRQHMEQKPTNELQDFQSQKLDFVAVRRIPPAKGHLAAI